jgi:hypothetical protein
MTFTHITTGHPGSVHDARVLRQSDLWDNGLLVCNMTYHIIADQLQFPQKYQEIEDGGIDLMYCERSFNYST